MPLSETNRIVQAVLFDEPTRIAGRPARGQFLKWIGNKQRFAKEIVSNFPIEFGTYMEPFLGSGAVLANVSPHRGIASDTFGPLIDIWKALKSNPSLVKTWYQDRWQQYERGDSRTEYEHIKASYNASPNGPDLLFLCRACYGGVVRFRKADGYMSTPIGIHKPIDPESFNKRADEWHTRIQGTNFYHQDYTKTISLANKGDIVYCDPPYSYSQAILYGAQEFSLPALIDSIVAAKKRGVFVALSIDGTKKSGDVLCNLPIMDGVFERELSIDCGRSMLKRFQMIGQTLEGEKVSDRLLLTC